MCVSIMTDGVWFGILGVGVLQLGRQIKFGLQTKPLQLKIPRSLCNGCPQSRITVELRNHLWRFLLFLQGPSLTFFLSLLESALLYYRPIVPSVGIFIGMHAAWFSVQYYPFGSRSSYLLLFKLVLR